MRKQQGFTMMELVIVIALSSALLLGMLSLFDWHYRIFSLEEGDVRVTNAVRVGLNNMSNNIAQGYAIVSARNVAGVDYTTGGSTLILQLVSVNSNDDPIYNTYDYVTYYVSSGKLYQYTEPGTGSTRYGGLKQLADNVQTFSLTYNNADPTAASAVTIQLKSQITLRNNSVASADVSDTIYLRNR